MDSMLASQAECKALEYVELNSPDGARVCVPIERVKEVQIHPALGIHRVLMRDGGKWPVTRECADRVALRLKTESPWVAV